MYNHADYMRRYRAQGKDLSTKAQSKAKNMAVSWVRANHPEVWQDLMAQAKAKVQAEQAPML